MDPQKAPHPAGPHESSAKTPYTVARWRIRPARPARPMQAPPRPLTPWHTRPHRPDRQPPARRSRTLTPAEPPRKMQEPRFLEPTLWNLAQQPARPRRAKSPPRPHTPLHGCASDRPGRHRRYKRQQNPHAPWHGGAAGRQPIGRALSPQRDASAKCPNGDSPQQPREPSPSPVPNQAGRQIRQSPHAPWHGGAAGRQPVGRALSSRRDAPAIGTDQESPQQPHGPSPSPLPERAGRRRQQSPQHRGTVAPPAGSTGLAATSPSVADARLGGTPAQNARTAILRERKDNLVSRHTAGDLRFISACSAPSAVHPPFLPRPRRAPNHDEPTQRSPHIAPSDIAPRNGAPSNA